MVNQRTLELSRAGVSIWLDDLSRQRLSSGGLAELVADLQVSGVTTNPTIFQQAIGAGAATGYQAAISACAAKGYSAAQTVREISCADVASACDVLQPIFAASGGIDGRVSIEVDPTLADDSAATIAQATQLWETIGRPNAMIKIPATAAGLPAISAVLARGISVNVTLIFSLSRYREVINAYLLGIEQARANGFDITAIHSVASFFISRLDTAIDAELDALGSVAARQLRGKAGVANARLAYQVFQESFASARASMLLGLGANLQRPLWASTGVKDPALPDTLYVTELAAPNTVNTLPEATLLAFADHGEVRGDRVQGQFGDARRVLHDLEALGIDYAQVTAQLAAEGVAKFNASWNDLLATVDKQLRV